MSASNSTPADAATEFAANRQPRILTSSHFLDELKRSGATRASSPPSDRLNVVHKMFDRKNFHLTDFSAQRYKSIQPALELASRFLFPSTRLFDFWVRLTHARCRRHEQESYYVLESHHPSPKEMIETKDIFEELSKVVCFYADSTKIESDVATAITERIKPGKGAAFENFKPLETRELPIFTSAQTQLGHDKFGDNEFIAIDIHPTFLHSADGLDSDTNPAQLRRFHFALAMTLVHETCHALWDFIRGNEYQSFMHDEPCIPEANLQSQWPSHVFDLGEQWEVCTLGLRPFTCKILPLPGSSNKREALVPMPETCVYDETEYKGTFNVLCMSTINEWFEPSVWENLKRGGDQAVPKAKFCATCKLIGSPEEAGIWVLGDARAADEDKKVAGSGGLDCEDQFGPMANKCRRQKS